MFGLNFSSETGTHSGMKIFALGVILVATLTAGQAGDCRSVVRVVKVPCSTVAVPQACAATSMDWAKLKFGTRDSDGKLVATAPKTIPALDGGTVEAFTVQRNPN